MLMSELESNATFTTTFKAGKGYEAPWLVLRADTEGDLNAVLEGLLETGTLADVVALANRFGKLYIDAQPAPTPPPAAPERNNAPPVYAQSPGLNTQQAQQPTTSAQGGLIPNITVHPFKACQCGNPLVFKKNIVGKFGPSNVFECPMRDWQDDESKRAHDSVFVKA